MMKRLKFSTSLVIGLIGAGGFSFGAGAGSMFPIATNSPGYIGTAAVWDGTNYLVGMQNGESYVGAQLVSANGTAAGPLILTGRTGGLPWASFSDANYLLIWADDANYPQDAIYGQCISRSGAPMVGPFAISASSGRVDLQGPQVVAYAGGKFLVIWDDYRDGSSSVYGQLISAAGSLVGGNFAIFASVDGQDEGGADVATDGTNFLVVCQHNSTATGNHNVTKGRFVSGNGTMSAAFDIGQTVSLDHNPMSLVFNGTNYLVIWPFNSGRDTLGDPIWSVRGRIVTPAGTFPGNEFEILGTNAAPVFPIAAFDGANYLLSWIEGFGTPSSRIRMQFLAPSGLPFGISFVPFTSQHGKPPIIGGVGFGGGRYFAVATLGTGFESPDAEVYGAWIPSSMAPPQCNSGLSYASQQFNFTLTGTPGIPYVIQSATNLASPVWTPMATNTSATGTSSYTHASATTRSRFYRAVKQ
jgi:hypothetical protein